MFQESLCWDNIAQPRDHWLWIPSGDPLKDAVFIRNVLSPSEITMTGPLLISAAHGHIKEQLSLIKGIKRIAINHHGKSES